MGNASLYLLQSMESAEKLPNKKAADRVCERPVHQLFFYDHFQLYAVMSLREKCIHPAKNKTIPEITIVHAVFVVT